MTQGACEALAQELSIQIRGMRRPCTDLVCSDYFELLGNSNGTFLSRWSYVFDSETKERWWVRLLPTSDIVFMLFTELVRAA